VHVKHWSRPKGVMSKSSELFGRILERLRVAARFAADKPDETAESTACALWLAAAGTPKAVGRASESLPELTEEQARTLQGMVERRITGEPLAYLVGRQEFMGHDFVTAPGALIPRRETELLGNAALAIARERAARDGSVRLLDLCTGSGNLAIALALGEPRARVWGSDLEAAAVAIASRNARLHGVEGRVTLLQGDLFGALHGAEQVPAPFHLIVCNPPYIPSRKAQSMPVEVGGHEPVAAFDGGDFGLSILFRLVAEAPQHLVPGGWLCFELGAGQGPLVEKRMSARGGYSETRTVADHAGTVRALLARKAE
jgi:release factor glutamine methyltransferase